MASFLATVLSVTWVNYGLPNVYNLSGEETYLCETAWREVGPRDTTLSIYCDYEPRMDKWIGDGEGPYIESSNQAGHGR